MSVEVAIICDLCGAHLAAGRTAGQVRAELRRTRTQGRYGVKAGKDYCEDCEVRPALRRQAGTSGTTPV